MVEGTTRKCRIPRVLISPCKEPPHCRSSCLAYLDSNIALAAIDTWTVSKEMKRGTKKPIIF